LGWQLYCQPGATAQLPPQQKAGEGTAGALLREIFLDALRAVDGHVAVVDFEDHGRRGGAIEAAAGDGPPGRRR
jgi:hypothetical protein